MLPNKKRRLRARAHALKPVVTMGQAGLTDPVVREIDLALSHHELIKVRIRLPDRDERKQNIARLCSATHSECIQALGQIATLYRKKPDPN